MTGRIYMLGPDEHLSPLIEQPYEAEVLLQRLLAKHPGLLAGEQVSPDSPRRWLLISREVGVPGEQGGGAQWSLDHLFIDQDGIPTLVEVKRSTNNQIRREVVGQMLDYAANGSAYWTIEQIRGAFERRCQQEEIEPEAALTELLDDDLDAEQFWQEVKTNLQAGRIRLVFVADEIPSELERIIEFLNNQMDPAEVLGLEVHQYHGEHGVVMVPKVVGMTARAQKAKAPNLGARWDRNSFLHLLTQQKGSDVAAVADRILGWADERELELSWGKGAKNGSVTPRLIHGGQNHHMITMWTDGGIQIHFGSMKHPPFDDSEMRQELARRVAQADPTISFTVDEIDAKWPSIRMYQLVEAERLQAFLGAWDWYVEQVRSS